MVVAFGCFDVVWVLVLGVFWLVIYGGLLWFGFWVWGFLTWWFDALFGRLILVLFCAW